MDPFKAFAEASLELEKPLPYRMGKVIISAVIGMAASYAAEKVYTEFASRLVKSVTK